MTEPDFNERVDDVITEIEDRIEDSGVDIDMETAGGILTLTFHNDSKIIVNRQTPVRQIWVAARSGGFHFDFNEASGNWVRDTNDEELFAALSRCCTEQAGEDVTLN